MITNKNRKNLYHGGLAEIVNKPSLFTLSYLNYWFCGENSLGRAFQLLNLPFKNVKSGLFVIQNGQLMIDSDIEQETLYSITLIKYKKLKAKNAYRPEFALNLSNILNPFAYINTIKLLAFQAHIINNGDFSKSKSKELLKQIRPFDNKNFTSSEDLKIYMAINLWPYMIAISYISDFYCSYLNYKYKNDYNNLLFNINYELTKKDWIYQAYNSYSRLQYKELARRYGLMSDDIYELTKERWVEISSKTYTVDKNISSKSDLKSLKRIKLTNEEQTLLDLLLIRSEAKRKSLGYIFKLRQLLIKENKLPKISGAKLTEQIATYPKIYKSSISKSGKGKGVSNGIAKGQLLHILSINQNIPTNTIGMFNKPDPTLSSLYTKCVGVIFLSGGIMSHGSIVARELGIPAIIDPICENLPNNLKLEINGTNGVWKLL